MIAVKPPEVSPEGELAQHVEASHVAGLPLATPPYLFALANESTGKLFALANEPTGKLFALANEPTGKLFALANEPTGKLAAQHCDWKAQWRSAFTRVPGLLAFLELTPAHFAPERLPDSAQTFPLRVPASFAARMQRGNACDPLLLQVLPSTAERIEQANFLSDPVADLQHSPSPGLIHKYASRALLIAAGTCAVNCRYCFRREYPYGSATLTPSALAAALRYIEAQPQINEVILSGGDPLALDDTRLRAMTDALTALPQITRIRLHSRTPIVLPARVDASFLRWVADLRVPLVLVVHSNHAAEWQCDELRAAMAALRRANVTLLNQAVLLAGVNDTLSAQVALSEALFAAGVMPYYLNLLDPVVGSSHFEVADADANALYAQMSAALPGFLLPKLVRDVPGRAAKSVVAAATLLKQSFWPDPYVA
jgi:L-lysine 2,3-aminomutase